MRDAIDRAVDGGSIEELVSAIQGAGMPDLHYAVDKLARVADPALPLLRVAERFASRKETEPRRVACGLVFEGYTQGPKEAIAILRGLVDDPDWTVRESGKETCAKLLGKDFAGMSDVLRNWTADESENVRRAVLLAVNKVARLGNAGLGEPLLKLIEPLITDRAKTVRESMGPSVIGGTLLRCYPGITFEYLVKWSTKADEQALWNVAMALSSPSAVGLVKRALIVLRKLSLDERRYVWRAVAAAMWKLGRKKPEVVRSEISRWLEDERRVHVAREALKFL
jgi:3-methyladenine DNA glycosylase AlkC